MPRATLEVADIFRRFGASFREHRRLPLQQLRVMRAIECCRTAVLGGHVDRCNHCAYSRISYNSCRNRHCPKCQNSARAEWVQRRKAELLPIEYFHVVFTIPHQLNAIALQNKALIYKLLFDASAETLLTIAADPEHLGAQIGFFSILHTWGQNLLHHPHVHCVVTGGGLADNSRSWRSCRPGFFLPVRVLSRLFRRLFLRGLTELSRKGQLQFHGLLEGQRPLLPQLIAELGRAEWVVYAKPPFGGPAQVLEYLGRYTHRVAISNQRLLGIEEDRIIFEFKDYRSNGRHAQRRMTLDADEFIRRFLLHTLPAGFTRIRHYGLLAGRNKKKLLPMCVELLQNPASCLPSFNEVAGYERQMLPTAILCPECGTGHMIRSERLPSSHVRTARALDSS
jgi:putative transposase/transposase-like zinc-binding protein